MKPFGRKFALAFSLLFVLPRGLAAADACPSGVKSQSKSGSDGEVSWFSYATLRKIDDTDWCYHRKVVLDKLEREYVNWPKGEVHKKVVDKEMTTNSCCYPDPRPEDGDLEHGYSGTKTPTKVYRGNNEPTQNMTWTSVVGSVYVEDRPVRIDLTVKSTFRKAAEEYECIYELTNSADALRAVWKPVYVDFFRNRLKELGRSFPIRLRANDDVVKISSFSKNPPLFTDGDLLILTESGSEAFQIRAPAYIAR